jgi:hypothetical protein
MKLSTTLLFATAAANCSLASLPADDVEALQFMREEEKLARDVYLFLHDQHGEAQFANVARSEQRHTDQVLAIMQEYGVEDPASPVEGVFVNPDLQALYDDLVVMGSDSPARAFQVGVLIEETDIADLTRHIEATANATLVQLYTNLRNGSENHLRAFASGLAAEAGFADAVYREGWFDTWLGWVRLDQYPWVQDSAGEWSYHIHLDSGGRYIGLADNHWLWTSRLLFPWYFDFTSGTWESTATAGVP